MNLIHEAKSHNIPIFEQMILGFGAVGTWHTADDLSSVFWHSAFDTGACLQAPPVEVNRFASNSGLSGLAVNVHRLRAACLATLRLDFALPKVWTPSSCSHVRPLPLEGLASQEAKQTWTA